MPRAPKQPDSASSAPSLFDPPRPGTNAPEMSVTELASKIKKVIEEAFGFVRVRGEIGSCTFHSNGHVYLTLKDQDNVMNAVCWRGTVSKLAIRPAVGMDVVVTGRCATYQSKVQIVIESMALAGEGALLKLLEDRRKMLAAEGLFDEARKRALPFLPNVIGVVTSPTGAVIRDILHRLDERFPRRVIVWPVPVQGEGASDKIAAAIRGFNALASGGDVPRPDLLIVARGGGSLEDLMPFNEENVVRAAAASTIPLISAVGHETDTTLIDYASDLRAPTPTAAAEKAVPVRADLLVQVEGEGLRLSNGLRRILQERRERVSLIARALGDPARLLEPLMQRVDERAERLGLGMRGVLARASSRVAEIGGALRHPRDVVAQAGERVRERGERLGLAMRGLIARDASRVAEMGGRIRHPKDAIRFAAERLERLNERKQALGREVLLRAEKRLERVAPMLEALSPRAVLGRGYGLVYDEAGNVVTSASALKAGAPIQIELHDGTKKAVVE